MLTNYISKRNVSFTKKYKKKLERDSYIILNCSGGFGRGCLDVPQWQDARHVLPYIAESWNTIHLLSWIEIGFIRVCHDLITVITSYCWKPLLLILDKNADILMEHILNCSKLHELQKMLTLIHAVLSNFISCCKNQDDRLQFECFRTSRVSATVKLVMLKICHYCPYKWWKIELCNRKPQIYAYILLLLLIEING